MLNIIATLVATSLTAHAPAPDFHKPVNVDTEGSKYENLINLSTSIDIPEFRQISDNEVSYEELKDQAIHNCKNSRNPSTKVWLQSASQGRSKVQQEQKGSDGYRCFATVANL